MSHLLANLDFPDFDKLVDAGYNVRVEGQLLITEGIPYLNAAKQIQYGDMITPINLTGTKVQYPKNAGQHVMFFTGGEPYSEHGVKLMLGNMHANTKHSNGSTTSLRFSRKPNGDYKDYFEKVAVYASAISGPVMIVDPTISPRKQETCHTEDDVESVFKYIDTNTERAAISAVTKKLEPFKIGIVGVGGTGSFILDSIAKTPVRSIDLFDSDILYNHNAFRAPGAIPLEILQKGVSKVEYFKEVYSNMHKHIAAHPVDINQENVHLLGECNFVFVSVDKGAVKKVIFDFLESLGIPYIDVGMGVELTPHNSLIGILRTVAVTNEKRKKYRSHISEIDTDEELYESNIQIAELNALNAATAVIQWKKFAGFYNESIPCGMVSFTIDTMQQSRIDDDA